MCFMFSTNFVWKISQSKMNWMRYDKKRTLVFTYSTRCSCKILTKLEFSQKIFEKHTNIKFHENPTSGTSVVPWGPTNRLKLIVTFCNFDNTSKNSSWSLFVLHYFLDTSVAMTRTHFSNTYFIIKNLETANPIIKAWIKKEVSAYYAITFYKKMPSLHKHACNMSSALPCLTSTVEETKVQIVQQYIEVSKKKKKKNNLYNN